jgi:hypothetical protein
MKDLSKFIRTIREIGFIESPPDRIQSEKYWDIKNSLSYSYNNYHIVICPIHDQRETRWSISKNDTWLSFGDNNQRNFDLDEIDLLKDIFKSEFRDSKIKKLGI